MGNYLIIALNIKWIKSRIAESNNRSIKKANINSNRIGERSIEQSYKINIRLL